MQGGVKIPVLFALALLAACKPALEKAVEEKERDLEMQLPPSAPEKELLVTVAPEGKVLVGEGEGRDSASGALKKELEKLDPAEHAVRLAVQKGASQETVIEVLNQCAEKGFTVLMPEEK